MALMSVRPRLMRLIKERLGNRTTSNAALRLCVFCRVLKRDGYNLGMHGKYSSFVIILTDIWQNIDFLRNFAFIFVRLYASLGIFGKILNLHMVKKIH